LFRLFLIVDYNNYIEKSIFFFLSESELSELCQKKTAGDVFFPERLFQPRALHLCNLVGGQMPLLAQGEDTDEIYQELTQGLLEQVRN